MIMRIFPLLSVLIILMICSCVSNKSLGYKLAVLNSDNNIKANNEDIKLFTKLLNKLDSQYPENAQEIFKLTMNAFKKLKAANIDTSLKTLLQSVVKLVPEGYKCKINYEVFIQGYVTARISDKYSHDKTIDIYKFLGNQMLKGSLYVPIKKSNAKKD